MKTKTVIYSRVSTDKQSNESAIAAMQQYAKSQNYIVECIFSESISGFIEERDELTNLKTYIKEHNIKQILCYELSRLGRSTLQTLKEIDYFLKEGVNIYFKKENLNTLNNDSSNKLLLNILSSVAELEASTIQNRMSRGKMNAVRNGKMSTYSIPPYGYIKDNLGMWSINEKEAKVIRTMFDMALQGISLYAIAQHLNSLNVPTRKTLMGQKTRLSNGTEVEIKWRPVSVARYFKNTIYKGVKTYKEITISIPVIVLPEIWDKVQQRFKDKVGYINKNKHDYLFKGMIYCGNCNRILTATTRPNNKGYYVCSGLNDVTNKCDNIKHINTKIVDDGIYKYLFWSKESTSTFNKDAKKDFNLEKINEQIEFYISENVKQAAKKKRVIGLYKEDIISDPELKYDLSTIKNSIIDNENQIRLLKSKIESFKDIHGAANILLKYANTKDYNLRREFVTKYVNKIVAYKVNKTNIKFENTFKGHQLYLNEKILYFEIYAYGSLIPLKLVLTPISKNVYTSNKLQYNKDNKYLTS